MIWYNSEQQDPLFKFVMVCCSFAIGDCVEIHSPTCENFGIHGTIFKLTLKCITMALDMDSGVPLHHRDWIYVLPKHLCLLNPESLSDEYESEGYLYGYLDYDPDPDSASNSLSQTTLMHKIFTVPWCY